MIRVSGVSEDWQSLNIVETFSLNKMFKPVSFLNLQNVPWHDAMLMVP